MSTEIQRMIRPAPPPSYSPYSLQNLAQSTSQHKDEKVREYLVSSSGSGDRSSNYQVDHFRQTENERMREKDIESINSMSNQWETPVNGISLHREQREKNSRIKELQVNQKLLEDKFKVLYHPPSRRSLSPTRRELPSRSIHKNQSEQILNPQDARVDHDKRYDRTFFDSDGIRTEMHQNDDGSLTITPRALKAMINSAITTALESAHRQWFQYLDDDETGNSMKKSTTGTVRSTFTTPKVPSVAITSDSGGGRLKLKQQSEKITSPGVMLTSGDKKQRMTEYEINRELRSQLTDLDKKLSKLDSRVVKVEKNFDVEELEILLGVDVHSSRETGGVIRKLISKVMSVDDLARKLEVLEAAVEAEHESSLQILDVLLKQIAQKEKVNENEKAEANMEMLLNRSLLVAQKQQEAKRAPASASSSNGSSNRNRNGSAVTDRLREKKFIKI